MEDEFALIACMVGSTTQWLWYIDSGESFHMTGVREYFSSYKEENNWYPYFYEKRVQTQPNWERDYSVLEGLWKDNSTSWSVACYRLRYEFDLCRSILQDRWYNTLFWGTRVD